MTTLILHLAEDLSPRLSDGYAAAEYRMARIQPYLDFHERIIMDFSGVRSANSSFINSLIAGTIEHGGEAVLRKLAFKGCVPAIQILIEAAVYLGMSKIRGCAA